MGAWKRSFLLESIIFSVHGSFAGGCWLLKHFQRFWGSHFGSIFAWYETRGMAWCYYYMVTGRFFQKVTEYYLLFYCVNLQIVTVFFQKSIFLRLTKNPCNFFGWQSFFNQTEKTFFFNHFFGWQKKPQKSLPWRPGVDEVFIAGGCPWSWYRSSRGEQWLLNGRKGSQWSQHLETKTCAGVEGGCCWYCMFGGLHNGRVRKESTM